MTLNDYNHVHKRLKPGQNTIEPCYIDSFNYESLNLLETLFRDIRRANQTFSSRWAAVRLKALWKKDNKTTNGHDQDYHKAVRNQKKKRVYGFEILVKPPRSP